MHAAAALVAALIVLNPAVVGALRAFALPPRAAAGPSDFFSHVFEFPHVPYEAGVRHIHSPEHIAATHPLGVPWFRIHESCPPLRVRGLVLANYSCSSLGLPPRRVAMFSTQRHVCNMLVFEPGTGRPYLVARLAVAPAGRGHTLQANVTLLSGSPWPLRWLLPLSAAVNALEDRLRWGYAFAPDRHLAAYRRMLLFDAPSETE